jgi:hypothetical protein
VDVTITIPDRLAPALRAAATANKDADAAAFCARAVREALAGQAQQRVDTAQQDAYRIALEAARAQVATDLGAISAH